MAKRYYKKCKAENCTIGILLKVEKKKTMPKKLYMPPCESCNGTGIVLTEQGRLLVDFLQHIYVDPKIGEKLLR